MKTTRLALTTLSAVLLLAACSGQGGPTSQATPTVAPSPSPSGVTQQKWDLFWGGMGLNTSPPRNVATLYPRQYPALQNLTGGKVSDADAQKWLGGFKRTDAIDRWLHENLQSQPLMNGVISSRRGAPQIYTTDRDQISNLRAAGAVGMQYVTVSTFAAIGLAVVPDNLQGPNAGTQLSAPLGPYAFIAKVQGPQRTDTVYANGTHQQQAGGLATGQSFTGIESGTFVEDPVLGPIWQQASVYGCDIAALHALCSQLQG